MVLNYGLGSCFDFSEKDLLVQYLYNRLNDLSWITNENYPGKANLSIKSITERLDCIMSQEVG